MSEEYRIGESVEHRVQGYDFGKAQWIPATVIGHTRARIQIKFRLRSGKELTRNCTATTIRHASPADSGKEG